MKGESLYIQQFLNIAYFYHFQLIALAMEEIFTTTVVINHQGLKYTTQYNQ